MIMTDAEAKKAAVHLAKHDPKLASVIAKAGLCTLRPHKNYYQELVESIVGQQLSVKAAATIRKRFCDLFGADFPSPKQILAKDIETLRGVGLSRGKAAYVRDLAQHVIDGKVKFDHLDKLSNQEVIATLTAIKGVGEWTAHMFLMFCMGRTDVLATGDLGIKNGVQKLYGLKQQPTAEDIVKLAQKYSWHPYESIACWYVWQSLDNAPNV
jgi:DNA-3-methyladenine glycosylase II